MTYGSGSLAVAEKLVERSQVLGRRLDIKLDPGNPLLLAKITKTGSERWAPVPVGRFIVRLREEPEEIRMRFIGARVRAERQLRNLTQDELARHSGIARANIARLEAGTHMPAIPTLKRVANALGVKVATLLEKPSYSPTSEDKRWIDDGIGAWATALQREDQKP